MGVKGAGESATTGAPAAVMNALRDALQAAGAGPVDMPATPERVYQALQRGPALTRRDPRPQYPRRGRLAASTVPRNPAVDPGVGGIEFIVEIGGMP